MFILVRAAGYLSQNSNVGDVVYLFEIFSVSVAPDASVELFSAGEPLESSFQFFIVDGAKVASVELLAIKDVLAVSFAQFLIGVTQSASVELVSTVNVVFAKLALFVVNIVEEELPPTSDPPVFAAQTSFSGVVPGASL